MRPAFVSVLEALREQKNLTRTGIVKFSGRSRKSVWASLSFLEAKGYVTETPSAGGYGFYELTIKGSSVVSVLSEVFDEATTHKSRTQACTKGIEEVGTQTSS